MLKLTSSFACAIAALQISTIGHTESLPKPAVAPKSEVPSTQKPEATKLAPGLKADETPKVESAAPVAATPPPVNWATAPASSGAPDASAPASSTAPPGAVPATASPNPAAPPNPRQVVIMQRAPLPVVVTQTPPPDIVEQPKTYEYRATISLDLANVIWRTNHGYDLFSKNDASWRVAIGLGYDLVKLPNQLIFAAEIGGMLEPGQGSTSDNGLLGNTLKGDLSGATLLVGGSLRWAPVPWLAPYGRLQLLTTRYSIDISTDGNGGTSTGGEWSYHRWASGGALGAGVMLHLPPRSPVNVGLLVEGGYWLQQSVDILLDSGGTPSGNITTYGARLGSLGNSGPYLRIAGVLRF